MIACIIEIILNSPLVLKALAERKNSEQIGENLLTLFHNQCEPTLRAYVTAQTKRKLQDGQRCDSPESMLQSLLQKCKIRNINGFTCTEITKCGLCSFRSTFQMEQHSIRIALLERSDDLSVTRFMAEYENSGASNILRQHATNCDSVPQHSIVWKCVGASLYLSFQRFAPTESGSNRRIAATKVTLPLVIAFAGKAFQLYAIIRVHSDETCGIGYDALIFDVSESEGMTKRVMRIDAHGTKMAHDELNDLQEITSDNVVLALYDDMFAKYKLWPKPMEDRKPDVELLNQLSHIGQLHPRDDGLPICRDDWIFRVAAMQQKKYIVHHVLAHLSCSQSYLPVHIANCFGTDGLFMIIRHFVDDGRPHDHLVHYCAWSGGGCHCEILKKKIKCNPIHTQVINRSEDNGSFFLALMKTLKPENAICIYSNNKIHINRFLKLPKPNAVETYYSHPLIDWSYCQISADNTEDNQKR